MKRILSLMILLLGLIEGFAQIPSSLVKDLSPGKPIGNGTTSNNGIYSGANAGVPKIWLTHNNFTYFTAGDESGYYLWKTNGTPEGTTKICFLVSSESSNSIQFCLVGDAIYFTYSSAKYGGELWKTDGTTEGTALVKDITHGILGSSPQAMANVNGTLYFTTVTGNWPNNVYSLWKSDGTSNGTIVVKNTFTDGPSYSTNVNGVLYFFANKNTSSAPNSIELWKSDGTTEGTILAKQLSIKVGTNPSSIISFNNTLFFELNTPTQDSELWKSDGTEAGTHILKDIVAGNFGSRPHQLTIIGNRLYFVARASADNDIYQLWETTGDIATTQRLTNESESINHILKPINTEKLLFSGGGALKQLDIATGSVSLVKSSIPLVADVAKGNVSFDNKTFFAATPSSSTTGGEIWASDGTEAGTYQIKNIASNANQSSVDVTLEMEQLGNQIIFFANDGFNGKELWKSDGTDEGTQMVKDINPGNYHSSPDNFVNSNNSFFFRTTQYDASGFSYRLWKSDGKPDGTVQLKNFGVSNVSNLTDVNGTLFFAGGNSANGEELWKSDGTPEGTVMVQDIWSGSNGSAPRNLTNLNGTLLFSASTGLGDELWKSDGISTQMVKDINPASGYSSSQPTFFTRVGNLIYFYASTSAGRELWKTDGTEGGTMIVKDIFTGSSAGIGYSGVTNRPFPINGMVYFKANDGTTGEELWKSDGTAAGTVLVKDIRPGSTGSAPTPVANVNGNLYFFANDGISDGLWKSDGTPDGTLRVKALPAGTAGISGVVGGVLAFMWGDGNGNNKGLWRSDGTEAGTYMIKDFDEGQGLNDNGLKFLTLDNEFYFTVYTDNEGFELWKTDGTIAGTRLQQDIDGSVGNSTGGTYGFHTTGILAHEGTIFYSSFHPSAGEELFKFTPSLALADNGNTAENLIVNGTKHYFMASGYKVIASVNGENVSDGVNPFKAKVTIDNTVSVFASQPYLQRHFDLEPGVANPSNSAATVTLFASQTEFTAFNLASTVKLPANSTDAENYKTNLRIWQWHGTPTTTPSVPGSYTGFMANPINPVDTDIKWNEALAAWEIRFNVVGFSGFFITAEGATPLPVTLVHFSAQRQENTVALNWQTTEETNSDYFQVQHSTNGKQWSAVGQVVSSGESRTLQHYTYNHPNPVRGENLYRIKMVDQDATFAMSRIVSVVMESAGSLSVFPNPATVSVIATSPTPISSYQLLTTNGRIVSERSKVGSMRLELSDLPVTPGLYILKITLDNGKTEDRKLVIK